MKHWYLEIYPTLALAGSLIILGSSFIAILAYRGKNNERYSITRFFVSELGEVGVSKLAWLFNGGLILGSFLLFLMMPGVGISLGNVWGYIGAFIGMIAAGGSLFVGIFPMNQIKPHTKAAMIYFRAGLATVFLFSIAILAQPAETRTIPLYTLVIGVIAFFAYSSFLVQIGKSVKNQQDNAFDTSEIHSRRAFWWMPFLEWMVVIFTILWFLIISVTG